MVRLSQGALAMVVALLGLSRGDDASVGDVFSRGLVEEAIRAQDVIKYHDNSSPRLSPRVDGTVLGYVTPWNGRGAEVAVNSSRKLDLVSPVWLQLRPGRKKLSVKGSQDIDQAWIERVRKADPQTKVVPRIILEGWSPTAIKSLLADLEQQKRMVKTLRAVCKKHSFDGLVLEAWVQVVRDVETQTCGFLVHPV